MSRAERRARVERDHPPLPISPQCRLSAVSRCAVYRRPAERGEADLAAMASTDRQSLARPYYLARPCYGSRRMAAWLAPQGDRVNRKRVRRLMRRMGLVAIYQRPHTSKAAVAHQVYRYLLGGPYLLGGIAIERVNQIWGSERHRHSDGQGLPLSSGRHGLGEPCRAGLATVEHARRRVLCRGARGSPRALRLA